MKAIEVDGVSYRRLIVAIKVLEEVLSYIKLVTRISVLGKRKPYSAICSVLHMKMCLCACVVPIR
jgi:hypothetical protein